MIAAWQFTKLAARTVTAGSRSLVYRLGVPSMVVQPPAMAPSPSGKGKGSASSASAPNIFGGSNEERRHRLCCADEVFVFEPAEKRQRTLDTGA
jgi:hypothetical protein